MMTAHSITLKRLRYLLLFLTLGFAIYLGNVNVSAASSRYVTIDGLNIRKSPNSKAKILGAYKKGTKITCYGSSGNWTKVKYKKKTGYVYSKYLSKSKPAKTYIRYVKVKALNIREKKSTKSKKLGKFQYGTKLTCYGNSGGWTKIKYKGKTAYVCTEYLSSKKPADLNANSGSDTPTNNANANNNSGNNNNASNGSGNSGNNNNASNGSGSNNSGNTKPQETVKPETPNKDDGGKARRQAVADYAVQFVGNPYEWGGSSLTEGADCSGFTMAVYAHFGYDLPHSSIEQRKCGTKISWSEMEPGDLICYEEKEGSGHVGIYIGNNQIVHASTKETGIKISKADYREPNCVRRIVK